MSQDSVSKDSVCKDSTRVLVTGAGGFIGRHLCVQLREKGYEVVKLLRRQEFLSTSPAVAENENHIGDINDTELLNRALDGVKIVFHLAGIAHVDGPDKGTLQSVNSDGTASLVKAAQAAQVQKIIFFSSTLATAAESATDTVTDYGESKYQAELLLKQASEKSNLDVCILRPVNVYGPGMKGNLLAMVRFIAKGTLPPLPKLDARFSLIAVSDLCLAAILAAESGSANGKTYIITDGLEYNFNEIEVAIYTTLGKLKPSWHCPRMVLFVAAAAAELLASLTGRKNSLGRRTYRNLMSVKPFSNSPICEELGFAPSTTFYNELSKIIVSIDAKQQKISEQKTPE